MVNQAIRSLVPMAHVRDVAVSIAFYEKLGLAVINRLPAEGAADWAWLRSEKAELMLTRADAPVVAADQAILFYSYCDDIPATHAALAEAGLEPGPIATPFYNPGGEFRLTDPDGYVLYVAQI